MDLILGTVQLGQPYGVNNSAGMPSEAEAYEIFSLARARGVTFLDTALGYGLAAQRIGAFHRKNPGAFRIITKTSVESVRELLTHRKELGVESLDTVLAHRFEEAAAVASAMRHARMEGLAKNLGVSVYTTDQISQALDWDWVDVIQLPFNLLDRFEEKREVLRLAVKRGKTLHARSVFLQGLLLMEPGSIAPSLEGLIKPIEHLHRIAKAHSVSIAELALRYACSFSELSALVIGVDTLEQLQKNLSFVRNPLSTDALKEVHSVQIHSRQLLNPAGWS